jgi:hypothetical protein
MASQPEKSYAAVIWQEWLPDLIQVKPHWFEVRREEGGKA